MSKCNGVWVLHVTLRKEGLDWSCDSAVFNEIPSFEEINSNLKDKVFLVNLTNDEYEELIVTSNITIKNLNQTGLTVVDSLFLDLEFVE